MPVKTPPMQADRSGYTSTIESSEPNSLAT